MTTGTRFLKRLFDIIFSLIGILLTFWIMLIAFLIASIDTKSLGLFIQERVGREDKLFNVFKIKSMKVIKDIKDIDTSITTSKDIRITKSGYFFRKNKIDELPQLFNVLFGSMSFVGPRPDVEGYADKLKGTDRIILSIRPGITGPASIKYKNEEEILAKQMNPQTYNDEVIWVDKIKINKAYIQNWSLIQDIKYIIKTVTG